MRKKEKKEGDEVEKSKKGRKRKTKEEEEADLEEDLLPESGLYTTEGLLFYHTAPIQLTKAMYKRAEEHGINVRSMTNYSIEETVQIFRNWHEFSTNTNVGKSKVLEYLKAKNKKTHGHIFKHQDEHQFWPKFCHGLPHRTCLSIKHRAVATMSDDFIKGLNDDWSPENLVEKIQERFFTYELYDEVVQQKMMKLLAKGYPATYAGEILNLHKARAQGMSHKLRNEERREDHEMLKQFFESAIYFGLSKRKIHEWVLDDNEIELDRLRKDVKLEKLGLRMHLSTPRCTELLKTVLRKILTTFREAKGDDFTDEEAWSQAIAEFSPKLPLREEQTAKALEIYCHHMAKNTTILSLKYDEELGKKLKAEGITGFQCDTPEAHYLHGRICYEWMLSVNRAMFWNLRREFRAQVKLHCLLWAYKRIETWEKLEVEQGKTRYQTVLESELANPLASKMTLKFLKSEKVCEWMMELRPMKRSRNGAPLRHEAYVEAFILYTFRKFGDKFKFPAKFRHLVGETSSATIRNLVEQISDPENSEYLTMQEVRETVEKASGKKISARVKSKAIAAREDMDSGGESDDVEEDPDSVEHLVEHSRQVIDQRSEEVAQEIAETLEKADPSKIRWKFRNREDEGEEFWLNDKLHKENLAMKRLAEKFKKTEKTFKSKEFISTSDDDSSDDDDGKMTEAESGMELQGDSDGQEDSEPTEKKRKRRSVSDDVRDSDAGLVDSEDRGPSKKKRKMTKEQPENFMDSESGFESKKRKEKSKKKQKRRDSEVSEAGPVGDLEGTSEYPPDDVVDAESQISEFKAPDDVVDSEFESTRKKDKKKKKRKHRESEVSETGFVDGWNDSEERQEDGTAPQSESHSSEFKAPEDVTDSENEPRKKNKKKQKKEKRRESEALDSENVEESEDVTDSDTTERKKKKKKRKRQDSDADAPDDVVESEVVEIPKKHKKKGKRRDSE